MDNKPTNITPTQQSVPINAQQQSTTNDKGLLSNAQQQQQQQQPSFQTLFGSNINQPQMVNQPANSLFGFANNANIAQQQQQQMVNQPARSVLSFGNSNAQQQQMFNQSSMFSNVQQVQYGSMPQQQMPYPQYNANNVFVNMAPNVMPVQAIYNDD